MSPRSPRIPKRADEGGFTLVLAMMFLLAIAALASTLLLSTLRGHMKTSHLAKSVRVRYVSEAALTEALVTVKESGQVAFDSKVYPFAVGDVTYTVESHHGADNAGLADDLTRLVAMAEWDDTRYFTEAMIRTNVSSDSTVSRMFGSGRMDLRGKAEIDSYDSALGTYSSQANKDAGDGSVYAGMNSLVASDGDIYLESGVIVAGDVEAGPAGVLTIETGATVLGESTQSNAYLTKQMYMARTESSNGFTIPGTSTSLQGYSLKSGDPDTILAAGTYDIGSLSLDNKVCLTVRGPAVLNVGDLSLNNDAQLLLDTSNGPVQIKVSGTLISDNGAILRPLNDNPRGVDLEFYDTATEFVVDNKAELTATIFAPSTSMGIYNGAQVFGAVVAGRITMDTGAELHQDTNLQRSGSDSSSTATNFQVLSWRPLTEEQHEELTEHYRTSSQTGGTGDDGSRASRDSTPSSGPSKSLSPTVTPSR